MAALDNLLRNNRVKRKREVCTVLFQQNIDDHT